MEKENKKAFHLIGIGGIGMSALARFLMAKNHPVFGSDLSQSGESLLLEKEGAKVFKNHLAENIQDKNATVVFSTAIAEDNPEIQEAKRMGCALWHRSDLLAYLMQSYQSIAVAGTHGKTSTSALFSHLLTTANLAPSFVIGGLLKPQNINSIVGEGRHFVLEADESDGSFLKYEPNCAIITNLEADHLNYYKDLKAIEEIFEKFMDKVQDKEKLFWCSDCVNLTKINPEGVSYGFNAKAQLRIVNFKQKGWLSEFDIHFENKHYKNIKLPLIGKHNALNAAAVFGLAILLGVDEESIREGFKTFQGVKRRSDHIGCVNNIHIYDDYAHHPTEVACLLKSFRQAFPKRRIIALFQPHRHSRFSAFKDEFAASFKKASEVWVTDVYSCNEQPQNLIDLNEYANEVESASLVKTSYVKKEKLSFYFEKNIRPHDVFITIGAGDVSQFSTKAFEIIKEKKTKLQLAIIKGSISYEHYVSLVSSKFYEENIDRELYNLEVFRILPTGQWVIEENGAEVSISLENAISKLLKCDCIIPAIHGRHGEDGMMPGFLEALRLPYIGTHYSLGSLNMNKIWMKLFVKELGIKVPKGQSLNLSNWSQNKKRALSNIEKNLNYPMVVKPATLGSTIGLLFITNVEELKEGIAKTFQFDKEIVIEERIFGRELEVSCVETEQGLVVSYPGEVKSDQRNYDYIAKYSKTPIEKIVKPNLDPQIVKKCQKIAKKIYTSMQIKSFARIDFFLTRKNQLIFAEVNTFPGTTPRSLFQRTLASGGLSSKDLLDQMIIDALYRYRLENRKSIQIRQFLKSVKDVTHK